MIILHATPMSRDYDKIAPIILSHRRVRNCPSSDCTTAYLPLGPVPERVMTRRVGDDAAAPSDVRQSWPENPLFEGHLRATRSRYTTNQVELVAADGAIRSLVTIFTPNNRSKALENAHALMSPARQL